MGWQIRREDMSPEGHLQIYTDTVGFKMVLVSEDTSLEFCTEGMGGGKSPALRKVLVDTLRNPNSFSYNEFSRFQRSPDVIHLTVHGYHLSICEDNDCDAIIGLLPSDLDKMEIGDKYNTIILELKWYETPIQLETLIRSMHQAMKEDNDKGMDHNAKFTPSI